MNTVKPIFAIVLLFAFTFSYGQNFADQKGAIELSQKSYTLKQLSGSGSISDEISSTSCTNQAFKENHSAWFKWEVKETGNLAFAISPLSLKDDIDFIVYKLDSWDDFENKKEIRCMASGEEVFSVVSSERCSGITGLKNTAIDQIEKEGCATQDDNFLESIAAKKGEIYLLFVNNYTSEDGFIIEFEGAGEIGRDIINPDLSLSPNPAKDEFNISITSPIITSTTLNIYDLFGKKIRENELDLTKGDQSISVQSEGIAPGSYFISIKIGEKILSKKIILL